MIQYDYIGSASKRRTVMAESTGGRERLEADLGRRILDGWAVRNFQFADRQGDMLYVATIGSGVDGSVWAVYTQALQ